MLIRLGFILITICSAYSQEYDSIPELKPKLSYVPILFWSPVTGIFGGVQVNYLLPQKTNSTQYSLYTIYTQKKQTIVTLSYDRRWDRGKYRLQVSPAYKNWFNYYYGIGNQTPDSNQERYSYKSFGVSTLFSQGFKKHWRVGLAYDIQYNNFTNFENQALLDTARAPGEKGGVISGLGIFAKYDTRTKHPNQLSGSFHQFGVTPYLNVTGSDYQFLTTSADFRQYWSPIESQVIAYQVYVNLNWGNLPFYRMPFFGNDGLMRGYYPERFRDDHLIAAQVEYRMHLFWKIGAVTWGGYGAVADRLRQFEPSAFKYTTGFGLRITVDENNNTQIGIDLGVGKKSSFLTVLLGDSF